MQILNNEKAYVTSSCLPTDNTQQPFFIQIHITQRCSLKCRHCYQDQSDSQDLPIDLFKKIISETDNDFTPWYGPLEFNITGGNPLLNSEFKSIAEWMGKCGYNWNLLSSGDLLDRSAVRHLKQCNIGCVQISIDGTEDVHNKIRGEGHFSTAVSAIKFLRNEGIHVSVAMTVNGYNYHDLYNVVDWANREELPLGIHRWIPFNNGFPSEYLLSQEIWSQVIRYVAGLYINGRRIRMNDPLFMLEVARRKGILKKLRMSTIQTGCTVGVGGITVLGDGTVLPCRKLPIPIGNIKNTSLLRIWLDSPVLNQLRDRKQYSGKCGHCENAPICGGCRAHVMATGGEVYGYDSLCGN